MLCNWAGDSESANLAAFELEIVLNREVVSGHVKRFAFVERESEEPVGEEPGLTEFLADPSLSGTATEDEIALLRILRFRGKRTARKWQAEPASTKRCHRKGLGESTAPAEGLGFQVERQRRDERGGARIPCSAPPGQLFPRPLSS